MKFEVEPNNCRSREKPRPEPSDEMCSTHAGCVAALRCHILQAVIEAWRAKTQLVQVMPVVANGCNMLQLLFKDV